MRKTLVYLGSLLLLLWFPHYNAYGQAQGCSLQAGDALAGEGETVTLPVILHSAPNTVEALGFDLTFDPQVLQYTGTFTRGELVANWSFFDVSMPAPGTLRVGGFTVPDPIVAGHSGMLVTIEFRVVCSDCQAGESSQLVLTNVIDDIAKWKVCPGSFRFHDCVEGQGLKVGNSNGPLNTMISIPVTLHNAPNIVEALGFDLTFDPQVLQYTGAFTRGELVANWPFFDVSEPALGTLRIGGFTVTDAILPGAGGTVAHLQFQVICPDCATGDASRVFVSDLVDDVTGWPACSGTFTPGCAYSGDADESGNLTPRDALLVFQHFLRLTTLAGCGQVQADVDGNGEVTPADALEIFFGFLGS